jgi:hypothetical protein
MRRLALLYRSKGEQYQLASYYRADLSLDLAPAMAQAG